jgi:tetraacyldisaccharide 4'-kinase
VLAARTGCPVVVAADRVEAVRHLLAHHDCDVVVSDDGLQHYALTRDVEIALIDGERGFGNGRCLPAGPLREPISRLGEVDLIVSSGRASGCVQRQVPGRETAAKTEWVMEIVPRAFVSVRDGQRIGASEFAAEHAHVRAVAGIGNPERFFGTLRGLGMEGRESAFGDHHRFVPQDLRFDDEMPIVMTEKDATKVRRMNPDDMPQCCWYLEIDAVMSAGAQAALSDQLTSRGIVARGSRSTGVLAEQER